MEQQLAPLTSEYEEVSINEAKHKTSYPINWLLKANLDLYRRANRNDWDAIFIIDGREGSGKSTLAFQLARYCDPTFNGNRVAFTPLDFMEAIKNADKYQSIVYDESRRGLNARRSMSSINQTIISLIAEIRQKNLFVFFIIPTVFDLDKTIACWRARALIHVYAELQTNMDGTKDIERGYYRIYGEDALTKLYILGKKFYAYDKPKADFSGRFKGVWAIDEQEYRDKKSESLQKYAKETIRTRQVMEATKILYLRLRPWVEERGLNATKKEWSEIINVDINTLYNWEKETIL